MRVLVLTLLVFGSAAAIAADWVWITDDGPDGSTISLDRDSITSGVFKKAWFKSVYKTPQPIPDGTPKREPKAKNYIESLQLLHFDCDDRKIAMSQVIYRDSSRTTVAGLEVVSPYAAGFNEIPPESNGETMLLAVCKGKFPAKE